MTLNPIARSTITLVLAAVIGTGLVAVTDNLTRDRIIENERNAILRSLHEIIPTELYDNDLLHDTITIGDKKLLGRSDSVTAYRARAGNKPVAVVLTPVAPDGYGGDIKLLVGILADGTLAGVRVVSHKETPGLGDNIETDRSDWIRLFAGLSLKNPPIDSWAVKRDGGQFDQFTGATITPRAVVKAVRNTLLYFTDHSKLLFAPVKHTRE